MAIYHLSVKTVSRSTGRSATGAAAYRAGVEIVDERTGLVHDYTRRSGVVSADLSTPANAPAWASDRSALWNAAEMAETRKNSTVAREFELALPDELTPEQRRQLVATFARELVDRHGIAVDAAIHLPDREGDNRNHHAHVLTSTRRLGPEGFGEKARELDDRKTGPELVGQWRERWAELTNLALERAGERGRVDHRSLAAQRAAALGAGDQERADRLDRSPTPHLGPVPSADLRRARKKAEEPQTDRAQQFVQVEAANLQRQGLLARVRRFGAWLQEGLEEAALDLRQVVQDTRDYLRTLKEAAQDFRKVVKQERELEKRTIEHAPYVHKPKLGFER